MTQDPLDAYFDGLLICPLCGADIKQYEAHGDKYNICSNADCSFLDMVDEF